VLYGFVFTNSASRMKVTPFSTSTVTANVNADAAVDLPDDPGGAAVVM
jgi:hypothetical protein